MIFKDQRPRKNLNTLTPSNYSLNKQCSRWWHQKVGCLCSRLKFETNLETQTSFQTRAMFMQRNKGLSFFVPQRRSPLFHCNKAAPTTTKYWPPHYIGELASIYIYIYTWTYTKHRGRYDTSQIRRIRRHHHLFRPTLKIRKLARKRSR